MRPWIATLVFLLLFALAPHPVEAQSPHHPAIGALYTELKGGWYRVCTYFITWSVPNGSLFVNYFYSAGHCNGSKMWVKDVYGNKFWAQLLLTWHPQAHDVLLGAFWTPYRIEPLELVFVNPAGAMPLPPAGGLPPLFAEPQKTEESILQTTIVGYGGGKRWIATAPVYQNEAARNTKFDVWFALWRGFSGAPVMIRGTRQVIGMITHVTPRHIACGNSRECTEAPAIALSSRTLYQLATYLR